MSREFERQLRSAMKNLGTGSIPTTDYSMGETFAQGDLKFPSAPQFSMPKPRELGINRDFSGKQMSLYFQNAKFKGPKKETIDNMNQRATEAGGIFGEEMTARKEGRMPRSARESARRQQEADMRSIQQDYARGYGADTGNAYEDAYSDTLNKVQKTLNEPPMQDESSNPAPTPDKTLDDVTKTPKAKTPKAPKTPKTPKPTNTGGAPEAPKAPTPQAPQAPTPQAPTPKIPNGGRRTGSRREDAVGDTVGGVKSTTKPLTKPLVKPLTKTTTGASRGTDTSDARNPGRRTPKKGRYT